MQRVIFTIIFFIVIGGIGMYFGNRKVNATVARQRWLKYIVYILITSIVVLSIWFRFFPVLALFIVLIGCIELIKTFYTNEKLWLAFIVYFFIAAGFIVFAWKVIKQFQFFIYLQVLAFDAFSQITGQLIGKTPIAPKISPSKTWEGLFGGFFFCILAAVLLSRWMEMSIIAASGFGLLTAMTGLAGDMLASFYKRVVGIKDYSNLLPGQGGFLDRFDSFMMASFWYTILYFIVSRMSFAF